MYFTGHGPRHGQGSAALEDHQEGGNLHARRLDRYLNLKPQTPNLEPWTLKLHACGRNRDTFPTVLSTVHLSCKYTSGTDFRFFFLWIDLMVEWNKDLYGTSEKSPRDRKARILKSTFYSGLWKKRKKERVLAPCANSQKCLLQWLPIENGRGHWLLRMCASATICNTLATQDILTFENVCQCYYSTSDSAGWPLAKLYIENVFHTENRDAAQVVF